jgi:AraC-like DNA-binding protein
MKVLLTFLTLLCHCTSAWCSSIDSLDHQTTFIIESLPASTPHDASIYITTDFSKWYPDIASQKLVRNAQGQFEITLKHDLDTFEYKFTRGSWKSVEGRPNGRALPNREYIKASAGSVIHVQIESWEDISFGSYNAYMFFLLLSAFQGMLLMIAINTIRNKNKRANTFLTVLLFLITFSLFGRASTFHPEVFNWQPRLILVPELILFTYGPIFYFYVHKLLIVDFKKKELVIHFIPFLLQLGLYLPYLMMNNQTFIYRLMDKELFPYFAITGLLSLFFNAFYWIKTRKLIHVYDLQPNLSENQQRYIKFLHGILNIKAVYLIIWLMIVGIYLLGMVVGMDWLHVSENMIDILWLLFSFIIFALAYYAVKNPEVLREKRRYTDQQLDKEEVQSVLERINVLMTDEKIFLEKDLTLTSLANKIPTSSHTLSRVINEHYGLSFSDFVNRYRVDEFIVKAADGDQASFLNLAFQVGFSSKPTFNRAFKKAKGSAPRDFFKYSTNA